MNYIKSKVKDIYLTDIRIESIFIEELMPGAPADFVKVYLYARSYAETGRQLSDRVICEQLGLSAAKISEAWSYWETLGAIKKYHASPNDGPSLTIEFTNLKESFYGTHTETGDGSTTSGDDVSAPQTDFEQISRDLMRSIERKLGNTMSSSDMQTILSWIKDEGASPEIVFEAVSYCVERGKTSFRYMDSVIRSWISKGFTTADDIKAHLEATDRRHYNYRKVMQELGFTRNPSAAEKLMMDRWFDEMGYSMEKIIEACGKTVGISNPNLKYIDAVLSNWKKEADEAERDVNEARPVTQAVLNKYYSSLRKKAEREAKARTEEIYTKLPRIRDIDLKINEVGTNLSKAIFSDQSAARRQRLQEEMEKLTVERTIILADNDFAGDYTDVSYKCDKCNDTGITHMGDPCSCRAERMGEAQEWQERNAKKGKN